MLIGKNNPLNHTLAETLSDYMSTGSRVSPEEFLSPDFDSTIEEVVVFVNLIDLTNQESQIVEKIRALNKRTKIVAIHTFTVPSMIEQVINYGFDAYLSFFDLSRDMDSLMNSLGENTEA